MALSKQSRPAGFRSMLALAIDGVTPAVNVGTVDGEPRNAPSSPGLPRKWANVRNEPKPGGADRAQAGVHARGMNGQADRVAVTGSDGAKGCPGKPQDAPPCPAKSSNAQNEPISRLHDPPDLASAPDRGLSPRQLAAIVLLFSGHSFSDVGRRLNIDRKTLYRWRRSERFKAEVNERYLATTRPKPRPVPKPMPGADYSRRVLTGIASENRSGRAGR